jgi:hypothetical protein
LRYLLYDFPYAFQASAEVEYRIETFSLAAIVTYRCRSAWLFSVTLAGDRGEIVERPCGDWLPDSEEGDATRLP